jgi:hypothetical protein
MGLSCPSPVQPLPPVLGSPSIDSLALTWSNDQGSYHLAVCLRWIPPRTDSISIASFVVLRKRVGLDLQYSINQQAIPADTTIVRISIEDILPGTGIDSTLYRVFAVDSLGRTSDTSNAWVLRLSGAPLLEYPASRLDSLYFKWSVATHGYAAGFFSYMAIVNATGYFWQSPKPAAPVFLGENSPPYPYMVPAPDSLAPGKYLWIVLVDDIYPVAGAFMGSIAKQEFDVP